MNPEEHSLMNTLRFAPGRHFVSGDDNWLIDANGGRALDFYSDTGTASMGYHSEHMREVLKRALEERIPAHSPLVFRQVERDRAANRLTAATGMDRVFFCNSGTEAVEAAIKCARKTQYERGRAHRVDVYTVPNGFHGRTYGSLAAGDGPTYHHEGFGPLPSGFKRFRNIEDIRTDAAAVLLAPVFGNNDVIVYPDGWLAELKAYCDHHDILLIFDEVQSGSGRTGGRITYGQKVRVLPDILTLAKGVAMGVSCGACLARGDAAEAFTPGSHFSTFGGQPLQSAFVNGMLDYLLAVGTIEDINVKGDYMRQLFAEKLPWARNIRGTGLLTAFDIDIEKLAFAQSCLDKDLLVGLFRGGPGAVKITPPLTITVEEIKWGVDVLAAAYEDTK